jgi:hypothetical protein
MPGKLVESMSDELLPFGLLLTTGFMPLLSVLEDMTTGSPCLLLLTTRSTNAVLELAYRPCDDSQLLACLCHRQC